MTEENEVTGDDPIIVDQPTPKPKPKPKEYRVTMCWHYGNTYALKVNNKKVFLGTELGCKIMKKDKKGLIALYENNK